MKERSKKFLTAAGAFMTEIGDFIFYVMLLLYLGLITFNEVFPRSISGLINLDFIFLVVALLFGLYVIFKVGAVKQHKTKDKEKQTRLQKAMPYVVSIITVGVFLIAMAFKVAAFGINGYAVLATFALLFFVVIIFMLNS